MDAQQVTRAASDREDPLGALRAVATLRTLADQLEYQQVQNAVNAGHTWVDIATALGVTRQAVHKKYAKRVAQPGGSHASRPAGRANQAERKPR